MPGRGSGPGEKPVNKDYCFRHAQWFEGWECPRCAGDKDAPPAPGVATHAPGGGAAAGSGPSAGALVTPQARSASRDRSTEAQHLLDAGDPRQALEISERAIELDPSNLHAYIVGARAADRCAAFDKQEGFLEEAGRLLHLPEYRRVSRWYFELLKAARDAAIARPIVASFIASGPWPPDDVLGLLRALIARGFPGEALRLLENVPPGDRSLSMCAYGAQLTRRAFAINDPEVDAYLAVLPAARRGEVLRDLLAMRDDPAFASSTLLLMRDAVRARYRNWTPEIQQALEADAHRIITARVAPEALKPAVGLALRLAAVTLGLFLVVALIAGSGLLLGLGVLLGAGAGLGGFVYGRETELRKRVAPLMPIAVEELWRKERDEWQLVLDDAAPFAGAGPVGASDSAAAEGSKAASPGVTQEPEAGV